jgi:hypothetical protein
MGNEPESISVLGQLGNIFICETMVILLQHGMQQNPTVIFTRQRNMQSLGEPTTSCII